MPTEDASGPDMHNEVLSNPEVSYDDETGLYTIKVELDEVKAETLSPPQKLKLGVQQNGSGAYIVESVSEPATAKAMLMTMKRLG